MSWLFTLKDSELFILFAENSQICLKISVISILVTFIYLVALNLLVNNQLNSSLRHIIVTLVLNHMITITLNLPNQKENNTNINENILYLKIVIFYTKNKLQNVINECKGIL